MKLLKTIIYLITQILFKELRKFIKKNGKLIFAGEILLCYNKLLILIIY